MFSERISKRDKILVLFLLLLLSDLIFLTDDADSGMKQKGSCTMCVGQSCVLARVRVHRATTR